MVSIKIKSAFLPTSIDPISCSSPKTSAPLIVPIANASLEVKALGFNKLTFWSKEAVLNSSIKSKLLFDDAPSVPIPTQISLVIKSWIGAIPEANFILLHGLCEILTLFLLIISISLWDNHTLCAATTSGPKNPIESKYSKGLKSCASSESFISFWVSLTWIWIPVLYSLANHLTSSNKSFEAVYGEWGPKNTLILPSAIPLHFSNKAMFSLISCSLFSSSPKSIIP